MKLLKFLVIFFIYHKVQNSYFCWILNLLAMLFKYSDLMLVQWTKVYSAQGIERHLFKWAYKMVNRGLAMGFQTQINNMFIYRMIHKPCR